MHNKDAVMALAKVLWERMELLDPGFEERNFDDLTSGDKDFYVQCVEGLLVEKSALLSALDSNGWPSTTI